MSFPRYREYKDSGVEWLGDVPGHWEVKRIKRLVATLEQGWSPQCEGFPVQSEDEWGVLKVGCVNGGVFRPEENKALPPELEPVPTLGLAAGDLLISRANTRELVGGAAIVLQAYPRLMLCDKLYRIRLQRDACVPTYLASYLGTAQIRSQIELAATGASSSMLNIGQSTILELAAPVPPLAEQITIASFLDRETAKIDALVAEQEKLIGLLKSRLSAAVFQSTQDAPTRPLRLEHVVDVISRPATLTVGSLYEPLGLFNRGRGLFHKELRPHDEMGDSDFFWVADGDLIISGQFAWEGAVALAGPNEDGCVVSHRYPILRGRDGECLTEYLYALLCSEHGNFLLNESSRGAAGRNRPLNIDSLLREVVNMPAVSAQERVKSAVHDMRRAEVVVSSQRVLLEERRAALISAAVTGQIDVRGLVGSADAPDFIADSALPVSARD